MFLLRFCCASLIWMLMTFEQGFANEIQAGPTPLSVSFSSQGTCANTPVSFFPTVSPSADSLLWEFGDGNSAKEWSPTHTYINGGSFNVKVTAYLKGESASSSSPLNITQSDLQLKLVSDTTGCVCDFPQNWDVCDGPDFQVTAQTKGGTSPQFQWFGPGGLIPGQTTTTFSPDSAGYYYLVATDGVCATYAGVNIREYDSLDQRGFNWYFGANAAIAFKHRKTYGGPVDFYGPLNSPHGSSVISNRNGQTLFATDGHSIFDQFDQDITPAGGIGGDNTSTQSALIIPVPGDETLYYIFTTQDISGANTQDLRYSLFDIKINNGLGGFIEYNRLLFSGSTERLTGNANWLIAHEYGTHSFRAYPISKKGIGNPVISSIGSPHTTSVSEHGKGYMKLGPKNMLAVALSTPGVSNAVEVFDFSALTGKVSNFKSVNLENASGQVYGIEFSPGGNKLFATLKSSSTSKIYEFAIQTGRRFFAMQAVNQSGEWGALQYAADGQIYAAINGRESLATFIAVEDTAVVSPLNAMQPFGYLLNSTLGLPNFIQDIAYPAVPREVTVEGLCLGEPTIFSAMGFDPSTEQFLWSFGDGQSIQAGAVVEHVYAASGTYDVTLNASNKCESPGGIIVRKIMIGSSPPDPSTAVAMCTGAAVLDANPDDSAGLTYSWSTSQTTETITVNQQGTYGVTITDNSGCSTYATFLVASHRPTLDLGPDVAVCENVTIASLNAENTGATFSWSLNDNPNGNTNQTQSIDTSTPGIFKYEVMVSDPITNCFAKDSVLYTIHASPDLTVGSNGPIACQTNTGQITFTINSPSESLFSYSITGPSGTFAQSDRVAGTPLTTSATLAAGAYEITVSDQASLCPNTTAIIIEGAIPKPTVSQEGTLLTSSSATGNQWLRNGIPIAGAVSTTYRAEEPGTYMVRVSMNGCLPAFSDPTTVTAAEENIDASIHVYPNPTTGYVRVQLDFFASDVRVELYSITGLKKETIPLSRTDHSMAGDIDMKHYPAGMYLLMISIGKVKKVSKLNVL